MLVHVQESTHVGKTANWPNSQKIPLTWGINWCTWQHDSIAGDFPWGECPKLPLVETEWGCSGFRAANHPKGFSQLEHYNIWLQKSKEWPPCMSHRLKRRKRVKDWWILNKTFKISNGTCSLTMRDISCNQMRQITFLWFRFQPSCVPGVNTVHMRCRLNACGTITGGWGFELRVEPSVD